MKEIICPRCKCATDAILFLGYCAFPDKFTNRDIYEAVYNFYKESDREIKLATACAYGSSYCKYMLDKNIITESDEGFLRVKKNQSYQIKS